MHRKLDIISTEIQVIFDVESIQAINLELNHGHKKAEEEFQQEERVEEAENKKRRREEKIKRGSKDTRVLGSLFLTIEQCEGDK